MNSPKKSSYTFTCLVGQDKIVVRSVIDRKNSSIHLHLYGDMFGSSPEPIQVKNSDMQFQEGKETELITNVLTDHFSGKQFQVETIERLNDAEELNIPGQPRRIIVRLKDYLTSR